MAKPVRPPRGRRVQTAKPSRVAEKLEIGDEVFPGVTVTDRHNDPEGVWIELSSGDKGYTDYGVSYDLLNGPL